MNSRDFRIAFITCAFDETKETAPYQDISLDALSGASHLSMSDYPILAYPNIACNMLVFLWKTPMDKSIYSDRYAVFLKLLKGIRESQQVTQSTIAEKFNAPQSFVSKCESGQRRLDVVELMDWCDAVGVSFVDFARQLEIRMSTSNPK